MSDRGKSSGGNASYRILVTNDDGVESRGLGVLAAHLADAGHDVVVAAPMTEMSGSGAAIGGIMPGDTVTTEEVDLPDANGIPAFAVDGPPGRCVLAAMLGAFGTRPQLVLSGINPGANVGQFLQLHSGTLGAALTASHMGINAMAVSNVATEPSHWDTAATVAVRLIDYLAGCERRTTLNLNLPDLPIAEVKGLQNAPVLPGSAVRLVLDGSAPGVMAMDFVDVDPPLDPARHEQPSDRSLVYDGFAVVTRVLPPRDVAPEPLPADII